MRLVDGSAALLMMFDTGMKTLAVSASACAAFGIPRESLVGRSHYDNFPDLPDRYRGAHRRALAGEEVRSDLDLFVRADGRTHWSRWAASPWHDAHGCVGGIVISLEDVTLQRSLERSLHATAAMLDALFESVSVGIAITDVDGRYMRSNPAYRALLGYGEDELRAMCIGSAMVPEDAPRELAAIDPLRTGASSMHHARCRLRRKCGTVVEVEQLVSTIPPDASGPRRLAVFAHDVSERSALEARVRRTERLASIGMLGAGLGHDMGNVLFALRGALAGLRASAPRGGRGSGGEASVATMAEGIEYLQRLSEALHELAAPAADAAAGQREAQSTAVDLEAWWRRMSVLFDRAVPRGVRVEAAIEPGMPAAGIGASELTQVLLNVVVNAGQALTARTAPDARDKVVRVLAQAVGAGASVRIVVQDDGVGMDAGTLERAFEPFFTTRADGHGSGLGLAMVRRVVEAAGGTVRVDSTRGVGTEVVIEVPAASVPSFPSGVPAAC